MKKEEIDKKWAKFCIMLEVFVGGLWLVYLQVVNAYFGIPMGFILAGLCIW